MGEKKRWTLLSSVHPAPLCGLCVSPSTGKKKVKVVEASSSG